MKKQKLTNTKIGDALGMRNSYVNLIINGVARKPLGEDYPANAFSVATSDIFPDIPNQLL